MRIVEQSACRLEYDDKLELIEAAGRNCYKYEHKIKKGSAPKFVNNLVHIRKHYSVLGHAHICFAICEDTANYIRSTKTCTKYLTITNHKAWLVSGNFWAWKEFFEREKATILHGMPQDNNLPNQLYQIGAFFCAAYPEILTGYPICESCANVVTESQMSQEEKQEHAVRTYRLITNRAIQQELTRHRPWDYSIESTRYVDYKKDIEFIKPVWLDNSKWLNRLIWKSMMNISEIGYQFLRVIGWSPEKARGVLPLDLSGDIIATATVKEWMNMLRKRTALSAHPQIRMLMQPIMAEIKRSIDLEK